MNGKAVWAANDAKSGTIAVASSVCGLITAQAVQHMAKVSQTAVQCFMTASLLPGCVIVADGVVQLWNLRNGKCAGEFHNILKPSKGKIGQQQGFVDAGERPHLTDFSSDITG